MAIKRKVLTLDEAVLTDASILAAGSGLPRRIAAIGNVRAYALGLSPTALYGFDNADAYLLPDLTPNGNNLAANGVPWSDVMSLLGSPLTTSSYSSPLVTVQAPALYPVGLTPFSVSFWLWQALVAPVDYLLSHGPGSAGWKIRLLNSRWFTGGAEVSMSDGVNTIYKYSHAPAEFGAQALGPGCPWRHFCFTYDGSGLTSGIQLYGNGVLMASQAGYGAASLPSGLPGGTSFLNIGGGYLGFGELGIWNGRVLTAGEVAGLFRGGAPRATWTASIPASATIREVLLPGALGMARSVARDARRSKVFLSLGGGPSSEIEPSANLNLPSGQAVLGVEFYDNVGWAPVGNWLGGKPYVGGPNGEGPVIIYEEADPPTNVTSIESFDGYVDVTLQSNVGTIPAPTSAAAPAVQVTGATIPAPTVLRLATSPAYPPANVVSIASAPGRISVTFDQPLGTGTVITNDPLSSVFVTGDSVLGNLLTVLVSAVAAPQHDPVIGEVVTLPTPTIDSTHATGIFQGAIIIRSALIKALQELREDPTLIRDALASLPQDILTSKKYGEKTIDECVRWFTATNVPVKLGLSLTNLTSPCISVELTSSEEAESTLGDVDYNVIERDPWNPTQARQLASVHSREAYNVIMMVQGEPEFLLFLDTLVRFGILRHKEDLLDDRGFARLTWSVGPAGAMQDAPGRENFFARTLRLNGFARNCWPVAPKAGQPLGFIESTHFGPRVAPVAQNTDGTATSTPQTPTSPGPSGADPFDPAYWLDRDMVSGQQTNATGPLGVTDEPTLDLP